MGGLLLIGGTLAIAGVLWSAVSCIEGGATARYEAAALARAVEVKDAAHATSERLRAEGDQAAAQDRADADAEIARIRRAEADAKAEAATHAARADDAEATAGRALALVDDMQGRAQECPAPDPNAECLWTCTLPALPE